MKVTPKKVYKAAASVAESSPYRFGDKVLLSRVAGLVGLTVPQLAPALLEWQRSGELELARIDLVAGAGVPPAALRRSMIRAPGMPETSGWHAVVAPAVRETRKK